MAYHEIIAVLESDGAIEIGKEDELGVLEGESQGFEVGGSHCVWIDWISSFKKKWVLSTRRRLKGKLL
jgi:hypothetical protein